MIQSQRRLTIKIKELRGFSLIEILVACALLALMGILLMESINSALNTQDEVTKISDRYHTIRQAMSRMSRELGMAYISPHKNPAFTVVQTVFNGSKDQVTFNAFGNVPHVRGVKQSDQREISYFIGTDSRTKNASLMRREQPNPDIKPDEGGTIQTLCENIREVQFQYWDERNRTWADAWDSLGSANTNLLPSRIKIVLVAVMEDKSLRTFMTETKIMLKQPLQF